MIKLNLSTLAASCFLTLSFIIGLFFTGDGNILFAPSLFCLIAFVALSLSQAKTLPLTPLSFMLLGFWVYISIILFWSYVPFVSFVTWLILSALPLTWIGLSLYPEKEKLYTLSGTFLLLSMAVLACWAIIQTTILREQYDSFAHHPLINPNNMGVLFNLGLFPSLALFITAEEKRIKFATLALFVLLFTALLSTGSQGAVFFSIPALLLSLFILRKPVMRHKYLLPFIAAGLVCGLLFFTATHTDLVKNFKGLISLDTLDDRIALWKATFKIAGTAPWTGTGAGTFYLFYPAIRDPFAGDTSAGQFSHMDPLQFWSEMGILAPVLFYGIFIAILSNCITALKTAKEDSWERLVIAACAPALLTFFLHMHISFPSYVLPIMIGVGFLTAAIQSVTEGKEHKTLHLKPEGLYPFVVFITLLYGYGAFSTAAGMYFMEEANRSFAFKREEQAVASLQSAKDWGPFFYADPYIREAQYYIEDKGNYDKGWIALKTAGLWDPVQPDISYFYGVLGRFSGKAGQEKPFYEQALHYDPSHFKSRMALVNILQRKGQNIEAMKQLGDAMIHTRSPIALQFYKAKWKELEHIVNQKRAAQQ